MSGNPRFKTAAVLETIVIVALLGSALLVFPQLRPPYERFFTPGLLVLGMSGAAAAITLACAVARNSLTLARLDLALAGYFVAQGLAWLANPGDTAQVALALAVAGAAVLLLVAASVAAREPQRAERITGAVVVMGVLVAAVALLEALGVALPWEGIRRPQSTLGNRNFVAAQVAIALPFACARLLAVPGMVRSAVVILLTLVIVLTRCRSVWVGVLAAGVAAGAIQALTMYRGALTPSFDWRGMRYVAGSVLAGIVIAATVPWPGLHWTEPAPLLSSLQRITAYHEGSGLGRVNQHRIGLAILADHPLLGVGPRNWDDAAAVHAHVVPGGHAAPWSATVPPQSDLLRTAAEIGLPGLGCALAALVMLVAGAWRRVQWGETPVGLTVAILCALLIAAVHGLFDSPLCRPAALVLIVVLAGLLRDGRAVVVVPCPRWLLRGLLSVLAAFVVGVIGLRSAAVFELWDGREAVAAQRAALAWFPDPARAEEIIRIQWARGQCEPMRDLLANAPQWAPYRWGVLYVAARCAAERGEDHEAEALLAAARRIEPHLEQQLGPLARPAGKRPPRTGAGAAATRVRFGQAQSHLEEFRGLPLISANGSGAFRPYLFREGAFVPLLDAAADRALAHVDLYSPTPLASGNVLLAGQFEGRREFDLYLLDADRGSVINLTATPAVDEGDFCVAPGSARLSYRENGTQRFAVMQDTALEPLPAAEAPGFRRCLWLDGATLLGRVEQRDRHTLYRCRDGEGGFQCAPTPALADAERVGEFWRAGDGRVGLAVRRRGEDTFSVYQLVADAAVLVAVALPDRPPGDVLGFDGAVVRYGIQGRYGTSLGGDATTTVLRHRAINGGHFAIAADCAMPRTLAVFAGGRWQLQLPDAQTPSPAPPCPQAVQIPGRDGASYPALYFGAPGAPNTVVWLHGGPRENVSPRYSPYFDRLNRLGYAVLALNYPGSTGFGAAYEARFNPPELVDSVRAAVADLAQHGARRIVVWSVSAGAQVLRAALAGGVRFSAVVDQAGFDNTALVNLARAAGVPYFGVRGSNDLNGPASRYDFVYRGGHDITDFHDFAALFERVGPFLDAAPALSATVAAVPQVAVDVGHFLAAPGATSARGRPEFAFNRELATEIARTLKAGGFDVQLIGAAGDPVALAQRTAAAREAQLFLSIHHDAVSPRYLQQWQHEGVARAFSDRFAGFSLFVSRRNPQFSSSLACASALGAQLRAAGFTPSEYHAEPIPGEAKPFADRANGVHYYDNLVVLRSATQPAVLLEAGVIVNRAEEWVLRDPGTQRRIAAAVAEGVRACLAIPPTPAPR